MGDWRLMLFWRLGGPGVISYSTIFLPMFSLPTKEP